MLQFEWPKSWGTESRESVRAALEKAIRAAMSGSTNAQIRGTVIVDLPNLGATPPEINLSGIRKLSLEHTALMVKFRYSGDFSVTLRGLQINLDTIGSTSADETDVGLALPFFCPLEMTLHDFLIDGMASIEIFQDFEENAQYELNDRGDDAASNSKALGSIGRHDLPRYLGAAPLQDSREPSARAPPSSARSAIPSGYGILLGAGGRRAMRPPEALNYKRVARERSLGADDGDARVPATDTKSVGGSTQSEPERHSVVDVLSKKVVVKKRTLKIQLFGNPLKNMNVSSNFAVVPGANGKVDGTVKMLIKPAIEKMMSEGVTLVL